MSDATLQQELLDTLRADQPKISPDADAVALILERYPRGFSGIAWDQVEGAQSIMSPRPKIPLLEYLPAINRFFEEFVEASQLDDLDEVTFLGDQVTDIAVTLPLSAFRRRLNTILSLPQTTYVLARGGDWCFNYTFEDDMYFGKASAE